MININPNPKNTKDYWLWEASERKIELLPEDDKMAEIKAKVEAFDLAKKEEEIKLEEEVKEILKVKVIAGFIHLKGKNYVSGTKEDAFEIEKSVYEGNKALHEVLEVLK